MATIYRCDRCHSEHTKVLDRLEVPYYNLYGYGKARGDEPKNYDLCESCIGQLNDFLKPQAKPEKS